MKINKIVIAIGLVLILGIVILIGGIRITKANVLSSTLQKNLVSRQLGNLDRHRLLAFDSRLANALGLGRLDDLSTLRSDLGTLSLLDKA